MSLFDERDMASITAPDFPGERLIVYRTRALAAERARKHEDLLAVSDRELTRIASRGGPQAPATARRRQNRPQGGAVLDKHRVAKHFTLEITDSHFAFARRTEEIAAEAALDGIYVVRTSLPATALDDAAIARSYNSLRLVERAFRCIKSVDVQVRPVYHWLAERVRAHVFLCMLAYYLEWHVRQRLAPMLYDDTDKGVAEGQRASVVAKASVAIPKQTTGRTEDEPRTGCRSTASTPCSPISPR
jgi:hypothetical protein